MNFSYDILEITEFHSNLFLIILAPQLQSSLNYQAGQYIEIQYPNGEFHPFSIANAPALDHHIELHIRSQANDRPLLEFLSSAKIKSHVAFKGPYGSAYYRKGLKANVILLAGGTGFAYIKAIIEAAILAEDERAFYFYWNVKRAEDIYHEELLQQWAKKINLQFRLIISQPHDDLPSDKVGHAHHKIIADHPNLMDFEAYISGPFAMVQTAAALFQTHGLSKTDIYSDML